jgi:hypothetical protein
MNNVFRQALAFASAKRAESAESAKSAESARRNANAVLLVMLVQLEFWLVCFYAAYVGI